MRGQPGARECVKANRRENFREVANAIDSEPEKRSLNLLIGGGMGDLTKCGARGVLGEKNWITKI